MLVKEEEKMGGLCVCVCRRWCSKIPSLPRKKEPIEYHFFLFTPYWWVCLFISNVDCFFFLHRIARRKPRRDGALPKSPWWIPSSTNTRRDRSRTTLSRKPSPKPEPHSRYFPLTVFCISIFWHRISFPPIVWVLWIKDLQRFQGLGSLLFLPLDVFKWSPRWSWERAATRRCTHDSSSAMSFPCSQLTWQQWPKEYGAKKKSRGESDSFTNR